VTVKGPSQEGPFTLPGRFTNSRLSGVEDGFATPPYLPPRFLGGRDGDLPPALRGRDKQTSLSFLSPQRELGGRYRWLPNRRPGVGGHW
jgi:hypothetical protein